MTEEERLSEIARGAIERHVGYEGKDADTMFDLCYTAAFRELLAQGVERSVARETAREEAQKWAQP